MFCKKCGNKVAEGTKFCGKCGQAVAAVGDVKSIPANAEIKEEPVNTNTAAVAQPNFQPQGQPVYVMNNLQQETHHTSVGGWIGWWLLCGLLPVIGVIITACCTKDPSVRNAIIAEIVVALILGLIALAVCAIVFWL